MEQFFLDALKAFGPTAVIIGVPSVWAIRVLWNENTRKDTAITVLLEKAIESRMQATTTIEAVTDAVKAVEDKIDRLLMVRGGK